MRQILIGKNIAYAAQVGGGIIADLNELDTLDVGAYAFLDDKGLLIDIAAPDFNDVKEFQIALGRSAALGGTRLSGYIQRKNVRLEAKDYSAPVKERQFVGYDGANGSMTFPTTLIPGTIATLRIVQSNEAVEPDNIKKTYEHVVSASDTTTTVTQGLVDAVNNDVSENAIWTAALIGAAPNLGIQLDADDFGVTFRTSAQDIISDATIWREGNGNSLTMQTGCGVATEIARLENAFASKLGDTSRLELRQEMYSAGSDTVAGTEYDVYNLTWDIDSLTSNVNRVGLSPNLLMLAIPDGATTIPQTGAGGLELLLAAACDISVQPVETGDDTAV